MPWDIHEVNSLNRSWWVWVFMSDSKLSCNPGPHVPSVVLGWPHRAVTYRCPHLAGKPMVSWLKASVQALQWPNDRQLFGDGSKSGPKSPQDRIFSRWNSTNLLRFPKMGWHTHWGKTMGFSPEVGMCILTRSSKLNYHHLYNIHIHIYVYTVYNIYI